MVALPPQPSSPFYRAAPIAPVHRETVQSYWNFLDSESAPDTFYRRHNPAQTRRINNEQQHLHQVRMEELLHRMYPGHSINSRNQAHTNTPPFLPSNRPHNHASTRFNPPSTEERELQQALLNSRITYEQEERRRIQEREEQILRDEQLARELQNSLTSSSSHRHSLPHSQSTSASSFNAFNSQDRLLEHPTTPSRQTGHQSSARSVFVNIFNTISQRIGKIFKMPPAEAAHQTHILSPADLRKELDRLGQENNQVGKEIKLLLKNKVGVDGITKNREEFTFQFDLDHPVFQDTDDMGIRTIHKKRGTWRSLQRKGLLPANFSTKDVTPVVTTTSYGPGHSYDRQAGEKWTPGRRPFLKIRSLLRYF